MNMISLQLVAQPNKFIASYSLQKKYEKLVNSNNPAYFFAPIVFTRCVMTIMCCTTLQSFQ